MSLVWPVCLSVCLSLLIPVCLPFCLAGDYLAAKNSGSRVGQGLACHSQEVLLAFPAVVVPETP